MSGCCSDKGMQVIELTPEESRSVGQRLRRIVDEFVKKHGDQAKVLVDYMRRRTVTAPPA